MINFPDPPLTNGQTFQSGNSVWQWDTVKWVMKGTGASGILVLTVTAAFTTPAVGGTVVVAVSDATWLAVNVQLFIVDAYYNVNSIAGNNLTLQRTA